MARYNVSQHDQTSSIVRANKARGFRPLHESPAQDGDAESSDSLCGWCLEQFSNGHFPLTTECCGILVGHACLEDIYDDANVCGKCSALRPVRSPADSVVTEIPMYVSRFKGESEANREVRNTQTRLSNALASFIQPWLREAVKLQEKDRIAIFDLAGGDLSGQYHTHACSQRNKLMDLRLTWTSNYTSILSHTVAPSSGWICIHLA